MCMSLRPSLPPAALLRLDVSLAREQVPTTHGAPVGFQRHAHRPSASFTTVPPFITHFTRSSSVMSFVGSPETATMSANEPLATTPTLPDQPISSAAEALAVPMACIYAIPSSV